MTKMLVVGSLATRRDNLDYRAGLVSNESLGEAC